MLIKSLMKKHCYLHLLAVFLLFSTEKGKSTDRKPKTFDRESADRIALASGRYQKHMSIIMKLAN